MISTPSKPTEALASNLSRKLPLSATVAMHFLSGMENGWTSATIDLPYYERDHKELEATCHAFAAERTESLEARPLRI